MSGLHTMHEAGRLYEIDTRLRPSGNKGLLVSSQSAWERYHAGPAQLWERQALIKLRPVAGDIVLGRAVADAAARCVWGGASDQTPRATREQIAAAVTEMRDRIERELARGRDVKAGRGGLIDIEFAAQYVQLVHGGSHPELRVHATVAALERAAELGVADAQDCSVLIDAYVFLRRLEDRMRIVHDLSVHVLPENSAELDRLARRVGLADGQALARVYDRWTVDVRKSYERILDLAG
jgi:glutamate-ammonia-ligase adenylyltransferase